MIGWPRAGRKRRRRPIPRGKNPAAHHPLVRIYAAALLVLLGIAVAIVVYLR